MQQLLRSLLIVGALALTVPPAHAYPFSFTSFENPEVDAVNGWAGFRNTESGANFGFSDSNETGSVSGSREAGGSVLRRSNLAYFGDTTLGGTFTFDDYFYAAGEFDVNLMDNDVITIGHFDQNDTETDYYDVVGLGLAESTGGNFRAFAWVNGGPHPPVGTDRVILPYDGDYRFAYLYDPTAGLFGSLSVDLFDPSLSLLASLSYDLTEEQRSSGATFNAFGMANGLVYSAGCCGSDVYMDSVGYATVSVPEPGTLALMGAGFAGIGFARRRRAV